MLITQLYIIIARVSRGYAIKKDGNKKRLKKDKKRLDKRIKIVYNKRCRKFLQTAACE